MATKTHEKRIAALEKEVAELRKRLNDVLDAIAARAPVWVPVSMPQPGEGIYTSPPAPMPPRWAEIWCGTPPWHSAERGAAGTAGARIY